MFRLGLWPRGYALLTLTACTALAVAGGCIHISQTIELYTDGSATIELTYSIPQRYKETFIQAHRTIEEWQGLGVHSATYVPNVFLSRRRAERFFNTDQLELLSYRQETSGKRIETFVRCRSQNIRQTIRSGKLGNFTWTADKKNQTAGVQAAIAPVDINEGIDAETIEDETESLRSLLGDIRLKLRVTGPGNIRATNGERVNPRTAEWQYSLQDDASFLSSTKDIRVTFQVSDDSGYQF